MSARGVVDKKTDPLWNVTKHVFSEPSVDLVGGESAVQSVADGSIRDAPDAGHARGFELRDAF